MSVWPKVILRRIYDFSLLIWLAANRRVTDAMRHYHKTRFDENGFVENYNGDKDYHALLLALVIVGILAGSVISFAYESARAACNVDTDAPSNSSHLPLSEIYPVNKVRSGLVAFDSFTKGNLDNWTVYGSAVARQAPYRYFENSTGLYLGIRAANSSQWAGIFGETPSTNAYLFHAILTLPYATISDNEFNTGLYVQTTYDGLVNYVTCVASVSQSGYYWSVVLATGSQDGAEHFTTLWADHSSNQPLTRDCTIITNGENYLKVYLDGVSVYSNSALELTMPAPFYAFVEVQTTSSSHMRFGAYTDYYATLNNDIRLMNAPRSGIVQIIDSSTGNQIANGTVGWDGTARFDVGMYHMPINNALINIYDSSARDLIASGTTKLWGGDVYSVASGQSNEDLKCITVPNLDPM